MNITNTTDTINAVAKVFIVGHEGTTGLRIYERLSQRSDIEILSIDDEKRKDMNEIVAIAKTADIVFLCLPDAAAKEVVAATNGLSCKVIDASTAHRTHSEWAYGFAELGETYRQKIETATHIAVPGCHASGMIAILKPLREAGVLPADYPLSIFSLTGYSGGGKKMISTYESPDKENALFAPRQYGLGQVHKHLPEVVYVCGLSKAPIFSPIVDDYYAGMEVSVGFHTAALKVATGGTTQQITAQDIWQILDTHYKGAKLVQVQPFNLEKTNELFLGANEQTGLDSMKLYVSGNDDRVMVHAVFDNLGKGASGAAVQCMNIALGLDETTGLVL